MEVRGNLLHLDRGGSVEVPQVLCDLDADVVQVLSRVGVCCPVVNDVRMETVVGAKVGEVVVGGEVVGQVNAGEDRGLVGPAAGDVPNGVPAASEDDHGDVEGLHEAHALAVAFDGEVEAAEPVRGEGVGAALEDDDRGPEGVHDLGHDGLEDVGVGGVVDGLVERDVHRVELALLGAGLL